MSYSLHGDWRFSGNALLLDGIYHPDQLWLPFAYVFRVYELHEKGPVKRHGPISLKRINRKIVYPPIDAIITIEAGVDQYLLPFVEYRKIGKSLHARLKAAYFPAFDKGFNGRELRIVRNPFFLSWCEVNCEGRYAASSRTIALELHTDYIKACASGAERAWY